MRFIRWILNKVQDKLNRPHVSVTDNLVFSLEQTDSGFVIIKTYPYGSRGTTNNLEGVIEHDDSPDSETNRDHLWQALDDEFFGEGDE